VSTQLRLKTNIIAIIIIIIIMRRCSIEGLTAVIPGKELPISKQEEVRWDSFNALAEIKSVFLSVNQLQ
jgi:hypothetical protein